MPDRVSRGRIPELDGLRGAAIVFVLFYHYGYLTNPAESGTFLAGLQRSFGMGWAGVDLFFVLSGFLIGGILLESRDSPSYFKTFYARRFFRIIPLYYFWIALYFVLTLSALSVFLKAVGGAREQWTIVPIYMFFAQNMTRNLHSVFGTAWLAHLWSLAVEEQFYLFMPLAVRFLPRKKLVPVLVAAILAASIARIVVFKISTAHAMQYMLAPCRADGLSMGVLLAIMWRDDAWKTWVLNRQKLLFGVTLLLFLGVVYLAYTDASPYSFRMTAWGFLTIDLFFSCLIMTVLLVPRGFAGGIFRSSLLMEFGKVSYCIYIIHQVVNLLCHFFLLHETPTILTWQGAATTLFSLFATYGIAKISWNWLENPLLRRGHEFKYSS
jgi:peptidoglycan/LPS O-acetylase OafA/YrhL